MDRNNWFRCQYQKGDIYKSITLNSDNPISTPDILVTLCKLALKVRDEIDYKTGKRVALEVLKIHEKFIKSIEYSKSRNGASKSYVINKSRKKGVKVERIDLEFFGEYGVISNKHPLANYITLYREMKGWNK